MALFKSRKNDRVLDLTEKYRQQLDAATQAQSGEAVPQESAQQPEASGFNFLGSMASGVGREREEPMERSQPIESVAESVESPETRKRKLAKRLTDMTGQIETLSNQIYHLQQRIEVLERKAGMRIE